jgi:NADPH:quinone reductase
VRAAILAGYQAVPELGRRSEPQPAQGQAVVELLAAALNPADLAIASGSFPAGSPPLPYVPGIEGVGSVVQSARFSPGTRVWASGRGLGVARDGTFAEQFVVADDVLVKVPADAEELVVAALGVVGLAAWMPLAWLAPVRPSEVVLVLGATGNVGSVAVQAAKLLGAGRLVAVGRDPDRLERSRELGADAVVALGGGDFQQRLAAAVEGAPPALVLDLLWGLPLEVAARRRRARCPARPRRSGGGAHRDTRLGPRPREAAPDPRLLELRSAAGRTCRGTDLIGHAVAGRIRLDAEAMPLAQAGEAWARQLQGHDRKLVLVP